MPSLKSILWKISEIRTYFLRGHSNWFSYVISMLNFVTISFYLLIENLTIIPESLKLFRYYIIFFVFTYIPGAILVGYFDMKRGTYRVEQKMAKSLSPLWNDVFNQFDAIDLQQKEILQKIDELQKSDKN